MGRRKKPQNVRMLGADKTEITNDSKALTIVPGELTEKELSREVNFINKLFLGLGVTQAALSAGYTESYAKTGVFQKFQSPKFQNKIREMAKGRTVAGLPRVMDIYAKSLKKIKEDINNGDLESLSKLKHIPRDYLKMTGLLADDTPHGVVQNVNIESIQAMIIGKMHLPPEDRGEEND